MKTTVKLYKIVVNPEDWDKLYQIGREGKITQPVIMQLTPSGNLLSIWGKDKLENHINLDKVPKDFSINRIYREVNTGVVFKDKDNISILIHYPKGLKFKESLRDVYISTVREVLKKNGVDVEISGHRPNSNDFVFMKNNKAKKFSGFFHSLDNNTLASMLTITFNHEKLDGIFKLDTEKFKRRGVNPYHIKEVVGGLTEVNPEITHSIVDDIIKSLVEKLGWSTIKGEFVYENNWTA